MSQPLRIEDSARVSLITTKTRHSELWFNNNPLFEEEVLAYLAKLQAKYQVELYAATFQGNHFHLVAQFPGRNRASFMRDFNSAIQRALRRYQPKFKGSNLWARRYSEEWVPLPNDILDRVFYCALQPIANGLTEKIVDYPGYNSFYDAITDNEQEYGLFDASAFYRARQKNALAKKEDFYRFYKLRFARLPQFQELSSEAYKTMMLEELGKRTAQLKDKRIKDGKSGFLGRERILKAIPGSTPHSTKRSTRTSLRPLILTSCPDTRANCLHLTFSIKAQHREASVKYRGGDASASFPRGTYPPPGSVTI